MDRLRIVIVDEESARARTEMPLAAQTRSVGGSTAPPDGATRGDPILVSAGQADGLALLHAIRGQDRSAPVIVVSSSCSIGAALDAIRAGGDELPKDVRAAIPATVDPAVHADAFAGGPSTEASAPTPAPGRRSIPGRVPLGARPTLEEMERRYAAEILRETGGNKTRAAEILGIDRKTLYRLLCPPSPGGGQP